MSKMDEYARGKRDGVRAAVEWLHLRAKGMNDPHARRILDSAALHLGEARKADVTGWLRGKAESSPAD